ncbi:MAG TPA: hypothetical protein DEH78_14250 [Solibacterales bacterium]|nr:hypothetical protein [Bryobacterales bacterium]
MAFFALPALSFGAFDLNFKCVSNNGGNSGICNTIQNQFKVSVSNGSNRVNFKFSNNIGVASSITRLFFDVPSGLLNLSSVAITGSGNGVSFSRDTQGNIMNLPGGNGIGFSSDLTALANSPTSQKGVNTATEWVNVAVGYGQGKTFANVQSALTGQNPSFRIGIHVQSIQPSGKSDAFVTFGDNPPQQVVPEPGTYAALVAGGMGLFVWLQRRRRLN